MPGLWLAIFVTAGAGAQAAESPQRPTEEVTSLDRIRKGLQNPSGVTDDVVDGRIRFRISIEAIRPLELNLPWDPSSAVPSYVRPTRPLYHHEFLSMVTPEAFRSGVLYPGLDVLGPGQALVAGIRNAIRRRREEDIRRQIKEELRQLIEAQKKREDQKNEEKKPPR